MILRNKAEAAGVQPLVKAKGVARSLQPARKARVTASNHLTLQRACACGGACEDCREKQLQRDANSPGSDGAVPPVKFAPTECGKTYTTLQPKLSINQPGDVFEQEAEQVAEWVAASGLAFPFHAPARAKIAPTPSYSGKSDCSPTWFAETEPEVDPSGESFTGKLRVTYNDAAIQSPCVRECVEAHENVHVKHLTPIVQKIRDCDAAAGSDWTKKGKCNEMATRELGQAQAGSECEAYRTSFTCLTLKVLDPASPCSKSPHREVVQKHRGFEGCEMKKNCAAAGTPELGVPNA